MLAGDLVVAGYAVGVDGEQDLHAASGAGSDFGGRGVGGRAGWVPAWPMAAARAWCQIRPVEALAERAAAGTLEQLPLAEYQERYNTARPHQEIGQRVPNAEHPRPSITAGRFPARQIRRKPVPSDLINEYIRVA